ncbi:DNA translocase FtsK [Candidatus Gracilibacteria bacterium]|nr:DNA translocase FtsK [Candidatus Gracilibacteria bacterium]
MLIIGILYFFSLSLAEGSPVFDFMTNYAKIAFGDIGLNIFFGLCIVIGILIMAKGYLMRLIIKQFLVIMLLVSALLNFSVIDGTSTSYQANGGFISWPLIRIFDSMFGGQSVAVKTIIIILFVMTIARILYTFNFSLPKINLQSYDKPQKKAKSKSRKSYEDEDEDEDDQPQTQEISRSFIKELIKKKVEEKVEKKKPRPTIHFSGDKPTFSVELLESNESDATTIDEKFLMEKAKALQEKLMEFGVPITIEGFDIGPSIVQIRLKPDEGIRLSTIEGLGNDIKLSLKSKYLRIVAPIPGTDSVGIQIPNPKPMMVRVGDVIGSDLFQKSMKKGNTSLTLGKAIDGSVEVKQLEAMPHLLVAGATGSGKSVGVNDFILSLMYQNTPSELKFLMVDPKQVELEMYSGLPYMLAPIVSESDKALKLLKRAVDEMERRYGMLKEKRVKNIDEYNQKIIGEKLYRIVIVIDELADMMMSGNKKDVETCITRIAQKARAVGIHLIVATQRPSVNVITGLIKANISTRIAFGVVSEIDSRTILGRKGAEELIGKGDMLYIDSNTRFPLRIQAPFVSTEEIEKVVAKLKEKYMKGLSEEDIYNPEILHALENKLEKGGMYGGAGDDDELIEKAIEVIATTRKASATLLQRKLGVGFARAARIMDQLEERGIVGPQEGAKPRDIFL